MKRKTLHYFLVICFLFMVICPNTVFSEETKQQKEDIFTYIVEDGYATITNVDDVKKIVSVPETLGNVPVSTLAGGAFGGSVTIEKVIIPNTVTSIEPMCFSYCTELLEVSLPENLLNIESGVFNHCSKLRTITIPDSVIAIEKDAFYRCDQLRIITIPEKVQSIGDNAFAACSNISAATVPENVTTIGNDAFQKANGFRIYAKPGSVAEAFAKTNEIDYEELITISVNNQEISFDQPPITDTVNFRTLVPMRAILETLDATVVWDEKTDCSQITMPNYTLQIRTGDSIMLVNGIEHPLSAPAIEFNWRTMVPIRDLIESIGGTVSWNEDQKHIDIKTPIISIG